MKQHREFYDSSFYTRGGYFTWVLAGVTVVAAVGGGIAANQSKKKAQGAAGAQNKANMKYINGMPMFEQPTLPEYMPWNFKSNQKRAIEEDANYYARSDQDFKKRHAKTVGAEAAFEDMLAKDWKGEHEFMPQMQAESVRAGIADTLGNLGTTGAGTVLAPGGAGEANVARHLGLDVMKFQDRNRANRMGSLSMAEEIFPRRTFGMTGSDYVSSSISDVSNKNAWAAANYERNVEAEKARIGQETERSNAAMTSSNELAKANAAATAARDAAVTKAATSAVTGIATGYAGAGAAQPGTMSTANAAASRVPNTWQYNASGRPGKWASTGGVYA